MTIVTEQDLDLALQRLEIHDGDVFLLHLPTAASSDRLRGMVAQIQNWVERHGRPDVLFVALPDDVDVRQVSAAEMRRLGWERIR